MYFKVATFILLSIFFTGCSFFSSPKPKKPKNVGTEVTVVEEIVEKSPEQNLTTQEVKKPKTIDEKYGLKPEPFSLETQEDDPELLGPQTTIDNGGLIKHTDSNSTKEESL